MKNLAKIFVLIFTLITLCSCNFSLSDLGLSSGGTKTPDNSQYLKNTNTVTVTMNDYYYCFKAKEYSTGIIFVPKNDVASTAYAPLMHKLADKGYVTFILKSNDNIADGIESIFKGYKSINNWFLGGHHSGGTLAANYLKDNSKNFKGLFLLASYSDVDLSDTSLTILSILAENDKVLDKDLYNEKKANLGENLLEYTIKGANHSYFGNYGLETTDGKANITQIKQTENTISYILNLITNCENSEPDNDEDGNDDTNDDDSKNDNEDNFENNNENNLENTPALGIPYQPNTPDSNGIVVSEIRLGKETGDAVISANGTTITYGPKGTEWPTYLFDVANYDGRFKVVQFSFTTSKDITLGVEIDGQFDYVRDHSPFSAGSHIIDVILVDNPQFPSVGDDFTVAFYLDGGEATDEIKTFTLNKIEFKEPIVAEPVIPDDDDSIPEGLEPNNNIIIGQLTLGDCPDNVNPSLSSDGSTFTYGPKPANYPSLVIPVNNYDASSVMFMITFTIDKSMKICFEIDGQPDWCIDYKDFAAGQRTQFISLVDNDCITPTNRHFNIVLYIDGGIETHEVKNFTLNSICFLRPEGTADGPADGDDVIYYEESVESFANPDIGFYKGIYIQQRHYTKSDFASYFASSYAEFLYPNSLLHYRVDISEFSGKYAGQVDAPLSEQLLNAIDDALRIADEAGACVIIRFCYDKGHDGFDNWNTGDKEPEMNTMLEHIRQFTPILKKYKHCITSIECGMVGPWGEMHTSALDNPQDLKTILDEFLACIDNDMILTVRRPEHIYQYYGYTLSQLKKDINCFDYENNRLGNYNDGYLGSSSDTGTYKDRATEVAFLEKVNATRPFGGEVITVSSEYTYLSKSCGEMFQLNLSYLNIDWDDKVVKRWQNTAYTLSDPLYKGLTEFDYVNNHLGYRFVCQTLEYDITDNFYFKLQMKNVGFGELFKEKTGYVILTNGSKQYKFEFEYNNELTIEQTIDISGVDAGLYDFYFVLASDFTDHAIRGIRFANTNMYNSELMANKMAEIYIQK